MTSDNAKRFVDLIIQSATVYIKSLKVHTAPWCRKYWETMAFLEIMQLWQVILFVGLAVKFFHIYHVNVIKKKDAEYEKLAADLAEVTRKLAKEKNA